MGLLPLAKAGLLNAEVHINATTGSTGAGQGLSKTSHFSWRNNNLSIYKAFDHQHLNEIGESLAQASKLYEEYYKDHVFTHVSRKNIDLKQVVNTNKALVHLEKHGNKLFIISMIDNLLKGASGQAVQNMNLMFGLEETMGLRLKAIGF